MSNIFWSNFLIIFWSKKKTKIFWSKKMIFKKAKIFMFFPTSYLPMLKKKYMRSLGFGFLSIFLQISLPLTCLCLAAHSAVTQSSHNRHNRHRHTIVTIVTQSSHNRHNRHKRKKIVKSQDVPTPVSQDVTRCDRMSHWVGMSHLLVFNHYNFTKDYRIKKVIHSRPLWHGFLFYNFNKY